LKCLKNSKIPVEVGGHEDTSTALLGGALAPQAVNLPVVVHLVAGLAIKTHPKTPPKKPTKNGFYGFLNFFIFYENNTNFFL
jgi:hypothetical protein